MKLLIFREIALVGIVSPRQLEKTTLAKSLSKQLNEECVYIDIEDPKDLDKLADINLLFEDNGSQMLVNRIKELN